MTTTSSADSEAIERPEEAEEEDRSEALVVSANEITEEVATMEEVFTAIEIAQAADKKGASSGSAAAPGTRVRFFDNSEAKKKKNARGPRPIAEIDPESSLSHMDGDDLYGTDDRVKNKATPLEQIQPLPRPRREEQEESQPGAYANASVASFAPFYRRPPPFAPPQPLQPQDTSGLVVASAIDESSRRSNLQRAQELEEGNNPAKLDPKFLLPAAVLMLLGIAVLIILVLVTQSNDKALLREESTFPSQSPTMSMESYLLALLPEETLVALEDAQSPQSLAYRWIVNDAFSNPGFSEERILQRFSLATLYYSTQGHNWTNRDKWLSHEHHECDWYADKVFMLHGPDEVQNSPCNNETQAYERLWLSNNLQGTIPPEIAELTSLRSIAFVRNPGLAGTLPSNLHQLSRLTKMSVVLSSLTGTIPTQIGALTRLSVLYLSSSLYDPSSMEGGLKGSVPTQIGRLTNLQQVALNSNNLSGPLPTQLGLLTDLYVIALQSNRFTGKIPSQLGRLPNLWALHAYYNQLSGAIPTQLATATSLKELILANNTLEGPVPSQLGQLTDLYLFFLANNAQLTGSGPSELARLTKTIAFDASGTNLDNGSVPEVLRQAQESISFHRFVHECGRILPCPRQ